MENEKGANAEMKLLEIVEDLRNKVRKYKK